MLEKISDPKFKHIANPSQDAVNVLAEVLSKKNSPIVCEIGVGVGATTQRMAQMMNGNGHLHLFDLTRVVVPLTDDLRNAGYSNITAYGNSELIYDSYNWNIADLFLRNIKLSAGLKFDLVYLDGAHSFHHDAPATVVIKEMISPGGYILMDDYEWSFNKSPTMNPKRKPEIKRWYTEQQLEVPHVKMICEIFLDTDPRFKRDTLGGKMGSTRALYRRL